MENLEFIYFQSNEDINEMTNRISYHVKKIRRLSKKKYILCKKLALQIVDDKVTNKKYIEHILDNLVDVLMFYDEAEVVLFYKQLCEYYRTVDPRAAQHYFNIYQEL